MVPGYTPQSGATIDELKQLADDLTGTDSDVHDVMVNLGLTQDQDELHDDLVDAGLVQRCDDCMCWGPHNNFEDGLCIECYDEVMGYEDDDDFDDDEDDFLDDILGFEDDDLDDEDDIYEDDPDDYYFDETDDEDDL